MLDFGLSAKRRACPYQMGLTGLSDSSKQAGHEDT